MQRGGAQPPPSSAGHFEAAVPGLGETNARRPADYTPCGGWRPIPDGRPAADESGSPRRWEAAGRRTVEPRRWIPHCDDEPYGELVRAVLRPGYRSSNRQGGVAPPRPLAPISSSWTSGVPVIAADLGAACGRERLSCMPVIVMTAWSHAEAIRERRRARRLLRLEAVLHPNDGSQGAARGGSRRISMGRRMCSPCSSAGIRSASLADLELSGRPTTEARSAIHRGVAPTREAPRRPRDGPRGFTLTGKRHRAPAIRRRSCLGGATRSSSTHPGQLEHRQYRDLPAVGR